MSRPVYQLLPELSEGEFEALKADIGERGVMVPVEFDEDGNVLDGHHRLRACEELGVDCPSIVREGLSEVEKRSHARRMNLARRHLSSADKRAVIADELRDNPELSNSALAKMLGVSDNTVGSVRRAEGLESDVRRGADGKVYRVSGLASEHKGSQSKASGYSHTLVFGSHDELLEFRSWLRELKRSFDTRIAGEAVLGHIRGGQDNGVE